MALASTAYFRSGDAMRSRSVGETVISATLALPELAPRLVADCAREVGERLGLEIGDVEPLSLARARTRWPDYRFCLQAATDWTDGLGLQGLLADSAIDLMACRGARFHHDGDAYGGAAFCNLFLSEDRGLDVVFPAAGLRLPLVRGTALVFDTCQPHAVLPRGRPVFDPADFAPDQDWTQLFLTWELPIESAPLRHALGVVLDTRPDAARCLDRPQLQIDGLARQVCPRTGHWLLQA